MPELTLFDRMLLARLQDGLDPRLAPPRDILDLVAKRIAERRAASAGLW